MKGRVIVYLEIKIAVKYRAVFHPGMDPMNCRSQSQHHKSLSSWRRWDFCPSSSPLGAARLPLSVRARCSEQGQQQEPQPAAQAQHPPFSQLLACLTLPPAVCKAPGNWPRPVISPGAFAAQGIRRKNANKPSPADGSALLRLVTSRNSHRFLFLCPPNCERCVRGEETSL